MNSNIGDTCYCIVRHPSKAKFLVVKHEETWSPPILKFPSGLIDYMAPMINEGMQNKYGLKTRILRPVIHLPNYQCIEMELAVAQSSRRLKAVWVDEAEYMRTRSPTDGLPDPFELWFEEQKADKAPKKRPPFHMPGWFDKADHWMHFQLDKLGVQTIGSVEQFRHGWTSSCLLRVATNQGLYYMKAGYEAKPGEAVLTAALAKRWPQYVAEPLAVDEQKNWMLNPDFRKDGVQVLELKHLPSFCRSMAEIQLQSIGDIDHWQGLGCREVSLDTLQGICEQPGLYKARLQEGGGGLNEKEWTSLVAALADLTDDFKVLRETGIPLTLVHPDFRDDNLVEMDGQQRILDWNDVVISHPFFVLDRILADFQSSQKGKKTSRVTMNISGDLYRDILEAYLSPFSEQFPKARMRNALESVRKMSFLWWMVRMMHRIDWVEVNSPHYYRVVVGLQTRAKRFIAQ